MGDGAAPGKSAAAANSPLGSHSRPHSVATTSSILHAATDNSRLASWLWEVLPQLNKLALHSERPGVMNGMFGHPPRRKIALKKCFTIDAENKITVHRSRKVARETGRIFAAAVQFADLVGPDGKRLVEIWNGLPGVLPVAKFTHRKTASERIGNVLLEFGEPPAAPGLKPSRSQRALRLSRRANPQLLQSQTSPAGPPPLRVAPRCPLGHRSPVLHPPGESGEERAQDCQEAHSANQTALAGVTELGRSDSKMKASGIFAASPPFNRTRKNSKKAHFRYPISETNPKQ